MTKVLVDQQGFAYGWNYEMAKLTDLYTEMDSSEVQPFQDALRQPRRTLSGPEREALMNTGNTLGHYPSGEEGEITVVVPPSGLQTQQAMERRRYSIPEQLTLAPEPDYPKPPPMTPPPPAQPAARPGPQRVHLRKLSE